MTAQSLLERTLDEDLTWNRARIKFPAAFLRALLQAKTVNPARLAVIFGGGAQVASHYKRMQRFFRRFAPEETELARLILRLLKLEGPLALAIDRAEWQLGRRWVEDAGLWFGGHAADGNGACGPFVGLTGLGFLLVVAGRGVCHAAASIA